MPTSSHSVSVTVSLVYRLIQAVTLRTIFASGMLSARSRYLFPPYRPSTNPTASSSLQGSTRGSVSRSRPFHFDMTQRTAGDTTSFENRTGLRMRVHTGAGSAVLLTLAIACGGNADATKDSAANGKSGGKEQAASAAGPSCTNADTTPVSLAVRDFVTKATPAPQRYLSAAGTDSAVPEDGFKVLQDKGPTYYYSSDSVAQRKIREKLADVGPFASMLVVYKGQTATDGGRAVDVRLGGHYVGGELDGKVSTTKRYSIRCDSTGWRIASSSEEPGT